MKTKIYLLALMLGFFSTAHGQWAVIDSITAGGLLSINFVNADTGFAFNEWGTLRKTVDGGMSWDTVEVPFSSYINDIDFADANNGYAVGGAWFPFADYYAFTITKTNDGGNTWDSVYGSFNGGVFSHVQAVGPNEFYASGSLGVVHSTDGGATLDTLTISNLPFGAESYGKIQFLNSAKGYVVGTAWFFGGNLVNLYETSDGGQTWQSIFTDSLNYFTHDFVMTASGHGVLAGQKGRVIRTIDGGSTWQEITLGDTSLIFLRVEEVDGHFHAIGQNNADTTVGIYYSPDGGVTWYNEYKMNSTQGTINDISFPTRDVGYFISWQQIYKSSNVISVKEEEEGSRLEVFPNPAGDFVFVESSEIISKVILYNSLGQKVKELSPDNTSRFEIKVSSLNPGLYLMEVQHSGESFTRRLLKK